MRPRCGLVPTAGLEQVNVVGDADSVEEVELGVVGAMRPLDFVTSRVGFPQILHIVGMLLLSALRSLTSREAQKTYGSLRRRFPFQTIPSKNAVLALHLFARLNGLDFNRRGERRSDAHPLCFEY